MFQGLRNSFYEGVKNTIKTTFDGKSPIEVIISAPTKLVTTEEGDSTLTTGDGIVPDFVDGEDKGDSSLFTSYEDKELNDKKKKKKKGLKKQKQTPVTDADKKLFQKKILFQKEKLEGKLVSEESPNGSKAPEFVTYFEEVMNEAEDGVDDGVLNNEK